MFFLLGSGVGVVVPDAPEAVSDLLVWLDGTDASSRISSGGNLSQLSDKSGNNHHAIQATEADQPGTDASTLNGLNVIDFDQTEHMHISALTTNAATTTFIVFKETNTYPYASNVDTLISQVDAVEDRFVINCVNGFIDTADPLFRTEVAGASVVRRISGLESDIIQTGGYYIGSVTTTDKPVHTGIMSIGAFDSGIFDHLGSIAEIIIYNKALSDEERLSIDSYLVDKYALEDLSFLFPSVIMDLDASRPGSYPGAGQIWGSLVSETAMYRGLTAAVEDDDPTFVDGAFQTDGDNVLTLTDANTAFINGWHKTTGGVDFTTSITFKLGSIGGTQVLWATNASAFGIGCRLWVSSVGNLLFDQSDGVTHPSTGNIFALSAGVDYICTMTRNASTGAIIFYVKTSVKVKSITYAATSADSSPLTLMGDTAGGSSRLRVGGNVKSFSAFTTVLTHAEVRILHNELGTRQSIDYIGLLSAWFPSTVFDLEASFIQSYPETGQTFTDIEGDDDFRLGLTDAVEATDPTFVTNRFETDGGNVLQLKTANTAFINGWHKSSGDVPFTVTVSYTFASTGTNQVLWATNENETDVGCRLYIDSTGKLIFSQGNGSTSVDTGLIFTVSAGTDYIMTITRAAGASSIKGYSRSAPAQTKSITYGTTTADSSPLTLMGGADGVTNNLRVGGNVRSISAQDTVLSGGDVGNLHDIVGQRQGITY